MKKIITVVVAIMYLTGVAISANADNSALSVLMHLNILSESELYRTDTVTREECLVAIIRVIGATDETIENLNGADVISFADTTSFSYFECARLSGIAYGEECEVEYPTERTMHTLKNTDFFFFPERAVTVKECLAFMNRCLQSEKIDFDLTVEKAKDNGLINDRDSFIKNPDDYISHDDFFVLLERLLQEKRYKYYGCENNVFDMNASKDENRSMTYLESLLQNQAVE